MFARACFVLYCWVLCFPETLSSPQQHPAHLGCADTLELCRGMRRLRNIASWWSWKPLLRWKVMIAGPFAEMQKNCTAYPVIDLCELDLQPQSCAGFRYQLTRIKTTFWPHVMQIHHLQEICHAHWFWPAVTVYSLHLHSIRFPVSCCTILQLFYLNFLFWPM